MTIKRMDLKELVQRMVEASALEAKRMRENYCEACGANIGQWDVERVGKEHPNACIKCGTLWSRVPTTRATEDSLMRILAESMAKILEANPHQWFSQPCEACMIISNLLGRPFGCEKKMRDTFGG
jgi:hypothetical protein